MANYNKLATLMGEHQELATFRRFQRLNVKSLLGMQAELLHLESELAEIEKEDQRSEDKPRSLLHESAFNLKASCGSAHDTQWRKVLEVREKLEQYTLLLFSRVQTLPDPPIRDVHTLQEWLDRPEGGDFFLQGREADTWNDERDVLTLSRRQADRDSITGLINDMIIPCSAQTNMPISKGHPPGRYQRRLYIAFVTFAQHLDFRPLLPNKPSGKTCGNHGIHHYILINIVLDHEGSANRHFRGNYSAWMQSADQHLPNTMLSTTSGEFALQDISAKRLNDPARTGKEQYPNRLTA
ncbi:MAG: hypothetical protein Q9226_001711 [Calogaya cf. arnoldii]